jgi:hypothetical protein
LAAAAGSDTETQIPTGVAAPPISVIKRAPDRCEYRQAAGAAEEGVNFALLYCNIAKSINGPRPPPVAFLVVGL